MDTAEPRTVETQRRRSRLRLRILLAIAGLSVALVVFTQLDRAVVSRLGPVAESVYEQFNGQGAEGASLSQQRLTADVKSLGGDAIFVEQSAGLWGLFGRKDLFSINYDEHWDGKNVKFGDHELALLVKEHGDQVWGIHLRNSQVTNEGLRVLKDLPEVRHFSVEYSDPAQISPGRPSPARLITDAGLAHVGKLTRLQSLHLSGVPVTDAGLEFLSGLTGLHVLYLDRTEIQGPGLARLGTMPQLMTLNLSKSALTDQGLGYLSGTRVVHLLLDDLPLTDIGLKALSGLLSLRCLEIHRCGLDDKAVKNLIKSLPQVDIVD